MNSWNKMNCINSASPSMEQLIMFNDYSMMFILMITISVLFILISTLSNKFNNRTTLKNESIELIWTILPMITLIFIALPSLNILYIMEELINPSISLKIIGHQWYWSYEYSDSKKIEFESYMKKKNLKMNEFRLIEVDNYLSAPFLTQIRLIISSMDVIHSWTIPSLGIKTDAIPGRINQAQMIINKPGLFFGQCSEICGLNHSFMPISMESIKLESFIKWMKTF
uniref:Cytochrome c oxidase subunit 2 n=1 Tax=Metanigrus guttatus TaxID=3038047 RepID=A0AB38XXV4_9HEMI